MQDEYCCDNEIYEMKKEEYINKLNEYIKKIKEHDDKYDKLEFEHIKNVDLKHEIIDISKMIGDKLNEYIQNEKYIKKNIINREESLNNISLMKNEMNQFLNELKNNFNVFTSRDKLLTFNIDEDKNKINQNTFINNDFEDIDF
jgi:hypothetical protein